MPERTECGDCPPDAPCTVCNGHGYMWLLTVEEFDQNYCRMEEPNESNSPSNADLRDYLGGAGSMEAGSKAREVDMGAVIETTERGQIASLLFPLPECQNEFDSAINGWKWQAVLQDLDGWLRGKHKYEDVSSVDPWDVRKQINELCLEQSLDLWGE